MPDRIAIVVCRLRMPTLVVAYAAVATSWFVGGLPGGWLPSVVALALVIILLRAGRLRRKPVAVGAPVTGRWLAVNSPATRVPSHGVSAYGQTYALDLVHDPIDGSRPGFGWWPLARRPQDFPGFGQPVLAPADGVVVRVHDRERDHWSRTSPAALLYLFTVESLRDLFGPSRVLGNHVVLDLGAGVYTVAAHLHRHSVRVTVGVAVRAGEQIGECGNSGNSSEPHLHFQLQDHQRVALAAGLPFRFTAADGTASEPPGNRGHLVLPQRLPVGSERRSNGAPETSRRPH